MDRKLIELSLEYKYLYIDNNVLKSEIFINEAFAIIDSFSDLIDYLKSNLNNLIVNEYHTASYFSFKYNNTYVGVNISDGLVLYFDPFVESDIAEIFNNICGNILVSYDLYDKYDKINYKVLLWNLNENKIDNIKSRYFKFQTVTNYKTYTKKLKK